MEDTNKVSSKWKEVKLSEITTKLGDGLHGTPKYSDNGEYYFINGNNLTNGKIVFTKNTKKVKKEEFLKYKKELTNRTIMVSINGTLGNIALYNGENVVLGKSACYFNIEEQTNKDFIKYILQGNKFKNYIKNYASGTTIKNLSLKAMRDFGFLLPSLEEQIKISSILKSLDEKIEVNNQMNKTLEEMAQAIFKEWFVEFNFPITPNFGSSPLDKGEGGKILGYKDNGGEMVDSELGEIPKGWRVEELGKAFDVTMGQSPKGSSYNENRKGSVFYQGRTDFNFRFPSNRIFTTEPKRMAKQLDVLLSVRAPVGDVNVATEECCIGRGIAAITSTKTSFLLYTMKNLSQKFKMFDNEGTVFGSINKKGLEELKIIVPSDEILNLFERTVSSIDEFIFNNSKEIETLINIRDTLLPKLMSGEVRLSDKGELNG